MCVEKIRYVFIKIKIGKTEENGELVKKIEKRYEKHRAKKGKIIEAEMLQNWAGVLPHAPDQRARNCLGAAAIGFFHFFSFFYFFLFLCIIYIP